MNTCIICFWVSFFSLELFVVVFVWRTQCCCVSRVRPSLSPLVNDFFFSFSSPLNSIHFGLGGSFSVGTIATRFGHLPIFIGKKYRDFPVIGCHRKPISSLESILTSIAHTERWQIALVGRSLWAASERDRGGINVQYNIDLILCMQTRDDHRLRRTYFAVSFIASTPSGCVRSVWIGVTDI